MNRIPKLLQATGRLIISLFCASTCTLGAQTPPLKTESQAVSLDALGLPAACCPQRALEESLPRPSLTQGADPSQRLGRALWRYGLLDADSVVMQAVESGWTNHNFLVRLDKEEIFARVIGTETEILGINRDAEMLASGAAAAAGIAPQVLAYFPKEDVILYECIRGRALPKRYASNPRILQRVGLLFQQCHTMDVSLPLTVDPFERIQQYRDAMQHRGLALPSNERAAFQALAKIRSALAKDTDCAPCHLDVHTGNILYDGHQLWLVDWEYAAMSSPLFDLALYASTHNLSVEEQKNLLYFYSKQDDAKSISRLALYRMVADLYWACWGYLEDGVSELDQPYGAFARKCWDRYIQSAQHSSFLKHLLVADE